MKLVTTGTEPALRQPNQSWRMASALTQLLALLPQAFILPSSRFGNHLRGACFRDCGTHGKCTRGLCNCTSGWSGLDCSTSSTRERDAEPMDGFLYIFTPPTQFLSRLAQIGHGDPVFAAEHLFTQRALGDKKLRTLDPRRAKLFFVPIFLYHNLGNQVLKKSGYYHSSLVKILRDVDPLFNHTWSRNTSSHVFFFVNDKGACAVDRGPIFVTYWGLTVPYKFMVVPNRWKLTFGKSRLAGFGLGLEKESSVPCADENDIIVPPVRTATYNSSFPDLLFLDSSHTASECTLFFAGPVAKGGSVCPSSCTAEVDPEVPCAKAERMCCLGKPPMDPRVANASRCYGQDVRGELFAHHENRTGFCITRRLPPKDVPRMVAHARFCLAPSGEGFGCRLPEYMIRGGCIPIIIQPSVIQPFADVLPYHQFSLRFRFEDIPNLHTLLAAITPERYAALKRGLHRYAEAFDWLTHRGLAYEYTRYSLCLRAGGPCKHLKPGAPRRAQDANL